MTSDIDKKIHDIKAAERTLNYALENIKSGYRFDDEFGLQKIAAIEKALKTLSPELEILLKMYEKMRI